MYMGKTRKIIGHLLLIIIVITIIQFAYGELTKDTKRQKMIKNLNKVISTEEMKDSFMEGCMILPELEEYCNCTFDYVVGEVGINGFFDLAFDYFEDEKIDDVLYDAGISCVYLIGE